MSVPQQAYCRAFATDRGFKWHAPRRKPLALRIYRVGFWAFFQTVEPGDLAGAVVAGRRVPWLAFNACRGLVLFSISPIAVASCSLTLHRPCSCGLVSATMPSWKNDISVYVVPAKSMHDGWYESSSLALAFLVSVAQPG